MTDLDLGTGDKVRVFLHAINDAKPIFRISTKYAGLPKRALEVTVQDKTTGRRVKKTVETSSAHWSFRKNMGFNDQSDAKRSLIGLSAKYQKHWPKHLVAKSLEDMIINAYLNFLLDTTCPNET